MRKFKKLISCVAAVTLAATSLLSGTSLSASADTTLIENKTYSGDATYIGTYMREEYYKDSAFEIQFKYDTVGTPSKPVAGEDGKIDPELGYNDTFELLVFDTSWNGWDKTTIGPNGYNKTEPIDKEELEEQQEKGTVYTVNVPISVIEGALTTGGTPYGINFQTGGQLGTSVVTIVSLKLVSGTTPYVQKPFTATGEWTKGKASTFTVDPAGAATINANEWNIEVTAINLSAWTNPTVDVTVNYASASTDTDNDGVVNYAQAEIAVPTGEKDNDGNLIYEAVDPNYVTHGAGTYTYTTELPNITTSFIAAYDECTVTSIHVYNNIEGDVTNAVTGKTASEIATNMGVAWDLGNALEASTGGIVNEKDWGNPKTTKKLIQAVKAAGFNTIRVPISYMNMIDPAYDAEGKVTNYTVNDTYMARIQQVVNYAYSQGMYVVINIHNDGAPTVTGSWIDISKTGDAFNEILDKFAAVWTDIATTFEGYDQKLVFEGANELMLYNQYTPSTDQLKEAYKNINALNQAFVNAVRGVDVNGNNVTTDNNDERVLIVCGYNTNIDYTTTANGFVKPNDPSNAQQNKLMLSLHYYDPSDFALDGSVTQWPTGEENANNYYSKAYMQSQINAASTTGESLGMPIFLGEYGPEVKYTTVNDESVYNIQYVANYDYWLNYYARSRGNIVTAYWDNGVISGTGGSGLFDRTNNVITSNGKIILNAIMDGYKLVSNPPYQNPSLIPVPTTPTTPDTNS